MCRRCCQRTSAVECEIHGESRNILETLAKLANRRSACKYHDDDSMDYYTIVPSKVYSNWQLSI